MRVLNNGNTNQLPVNTDMNFKVGHIIEGKIIEILGEYVLLEDMNGNRLEAKSSIPLNTSSQVMNFMITDISNKRIMLKPIFKENTATDLDNMMNSLKNFNIKITDENIELVKCLMDNGLAVTKQNVVSLMKAKMAYEMVLDSYEKFETGMPPSVEDMDILIVLKSLLSKGKGTLLEQENNPNTNKQDKIDQFEYSIEKSINIDSENKENNNKKMKISYDKLVFLLKNKLEFNISNITHMNNIVMGNNSISEQLLLLTEYLHNNPDTKILGNSLEDTSIISKNKNDFVKDFNPDSAIKELYIKLDLIMKALEKNEKSDKKVLIHLENIKNSLEFISKINNSNQVFMQIPLQINETFKNMELFILKDKNKKVQSNNRNLKIFLSLNTDTLKMVQVLIDMDGKNIICNFQVETEAIKYLFAKFEAKLKKDISSIGFDHVNLNFAVSDKRVNLLNAEEKKLDRMNSIDIRV